MKYIGKNSISFAVQIMLIVLLVINVAALIFLPKIVNYYFTNTSEIYAVAKTQLLIILYPCGVFSLIVEYCLMKIFKSLVNKDPFVQSNVKLLNTMGISMIAVTGFFILKIFLLNSLMTMLVCLASGLLAVFCFVLADVFRQAVIYKQDNDLTV